MHAQRTFISVAGAGAAAVAALLAASAPASADVYVYRPRPVYVAPAPNVYVGPRVVAVGPRCITRTARVWVGTHYVYRTVRRCY